MPIILSARASPLLGLEAIHRNSTSVL